MNDPDPPSNSNKVSNRPASSRSPSSTRVAELAPAGRTGEYMGTFASTFSLALIVGPWLGVALLDRFGCAGDVVGDVRLRAHPR